MSEEGNRDWSDYLTGFLIGSIDREFPGTEKSIESHIDENYFIVTLGEEKKTRLKVSVHAEICENG